MIYSYCRESENLKSFFFLLFYSFILSHVLVVENRTQCDVWEEDKVGTFFKSCGSSEGGAGWLCGRRKKLSFADELEQSCIRLTRGAHISNLK